jgi:hypothetical protein
MSTKRYKRSIFCVAFLVIFAILCTQLTAFGAQTRTTKLRLTIDSNYDGTPIANEEFDLYEFAHYSDKGDIVVDDEFKDYSIDFDNLTEENWQDLAEIVTAYAIRDLEPQCDGETNENGILVIDESETNLTDAIYLIVGETVDQNDMRYSCEPFFVSMPLIQSGSYIYDPVVEPKILIDSIPVSTTIKTLKVWDDEESESRPESIEVQLLNENGDVCDTQVLSASNNWRYTWVGLDSSYVYSVVEKEVPNGYTVSLENNDGTFTLTNKAKAVATTTTTQTTSTSSTTKQDNNKNDSNKNSVLPKTGLSWTPVAILLIVGLVLVILGVIRNKNGEKKYES